MQEVIVELVTDWLLVVAERKQLQYRCQAGTLLLDLKVLLAGYITFSMFKIIKLSFYNKVVQMKCSFSQAVVVA